MQALLYVLPSQPQTCPESAQAVDGPSGQLQRTALREPDEYQSLHPGDIGMREKNQPIAAKK